METPDKFDQLRQQMNEDFKQHIGVLYEKFQSDIQLVAEQHESLSRKIDILSEQQKDTRRVVTLTFDTVGRQTERITKVEEEQSLLTQRVTVLEARP